MRHQTALLRLLAPLGNRGHPVLRGQRDDPRPVAAVELGARHDGTGGRVPGHHACEGTLVVDGPHFDDNQGDAEGGRGLFRLLQLDSIVFFAGREHGNPCTARDRFLQELQAGN